MRPRRKPALWFRASRDGGRHDATSRPICRDGASFIMVRGAFHAAERSSANPVIRTDIVRTGRPHSIEPLATLLYASSAVSHAFSSGAAIRLYRDASGIAALSECRSCSSLGDALPVLVLVSEHPLGLLNRFDIQAHPENDSACISACPSPKRSTR